MRQIEKNTLPAVLNRSAAEFPSNIALRNVGEEGVSYFQLKDKVTQLASFLKSQGLNKGDRIAILSENKPQWGIAYYAITYFGGVVVPIMTEFPSADVHHIIRHSESKAIFVSSNLFEKITDVEFGNLKTIILIDDFSIVPLDGEKDFLSNLIKEGKKEFTKIFTAAKVAVGLESEKVEEDDLAAIVYTSGTTGHSKGVMLTHKNIVIDAYAATLIVDIDSSDRLLSILPLAHTFECTLGFILPTMVGAEINYLNKPPTASVLLPAMAKVKPTYILMVPLVIEKIFKLKVLSEINKSKVLKSLMHLPFGRKAVYHSAAKKLYEKFGGNLKAIIIGGAALAADVEQFLREGKFPYTSGYGLTETSPVITGAEPDKVKFQSCGFALKDMSVELKDVNPETGEGEIVVKGPNVMRGYYKDPEKTKEVFTEDGWFRTGDLGMIDNEGYVFIKGRSKNVIIGSNGKNIYPEEIESVIGRNEYVLECLVVEREGKLVGRVYLNYELFEERFKLSAVGEKKREKIISKILNELLSEVNASVPSFAKLAKIVEQAEPFEKTPTQKIKRYLYD